MSSHNCEVIINAFEENLHTISKEDVSGLIKAREAYGESWKARGGVGAFMVLARKWDRIENQCKQTSYNIFTAISEFPGKDGLLDDIQDLRRYLMLVEEEIRSRMDGGIAQDNSEPGRGYTHQG